jgi:hypothetical protein
MLGRCPGRHLAEAMMWIFIATVLSQLQISKADVGGNVSSDETNAGTPLVKYAVNLTLPT